MNIFKDISEIDPQKYIMATYFVHASTNLRDAAWNIAIGQSVGNPNIRNAWETEELLEKHSCIILGDERDLSISVRGNVYIGFPVVNIDFKSDGISQLLCHLMGGHVDINIIEECLLTDLDIPFSVRQHFLKPKFGISGIRTFTGQYEKPLLGGIIKPKIGLSIGPLLDVVKEMVDGGVDFIKEDEIMSNPSCCPLSTRVDAISNYLARQSRKVVFCHTINCDPHILVDRVKMVHSLGGNGVHINVWSGLGAYNSIRQLDLPLYIHFQKSGDKVFTFSNHYYAIDFKVVAKLATMMGVDTIQSGMLGGYSNDNEEDLMDAIKILQEGNTLPALSCGMHPGIVNKVTSIVGNDYMANVGGAIHGHPGGTLGGTKAMRQAIDGTFGDAYQIAIDTWGQTSGRPI